MEKFRPIGVVLCVYEAARIAFVAAAIAFLMPEWDSPIPLLALVSPGALFLLLALFLTLDAPRFRAFGPLFLAGKALGVMTAVVWLVFAVFLADDLAVAAMGMRAAEERFFASGVVLFLVPGDVLSACMMTALMRRN